MSFAKVAPEFDRFLENFIHYELTKDEHPQSVAQSAATNDVSSNAIGAEIGKVKRGDKRRDRSKGTTACSMYGSMCVLACTVIT